MAGIESVGTEFQLFVEHLKANRAADLERLGGVVNGIEGWLKLEFYLWLVTRESNRLNPTTADLEGDVGLEYKVQLGQDGASDGRKTKQCDMWIRSSSDPNRFHYVELKCVFRRWNSTKMFNSAGDDFWYMRKLDPGPNAAPRSGSALILGIGFAADDEWKSALSMVVTRSGALPSTTPANGGNLLTNGDLRWTIFTHDY